MNCQSQIRITALALTAMISVSVPFLAVGQTTSSDSPSEGVAKLASPSSSASTAKYVMVAGRLERDAKVKYPKDARKNKVQGTVVLRVTVATDGKVREITTVSGDTRLVPAAREGVSKRKYQAFTHDGRPIEAQITTIVYFVPTAAGDQAFAIDDLDNEDGYVNVFRVGPGISAPHAIYVPDPGYTEDARQAKYQGTCVLSLVVGANGNTHKIRVVRALGMGLDQNAVEVVRRWRFQPATQDGEPVAVLVNVEVAFHLY